jgi:nitrogen-specific signal transduction histidine kinase
MESIGTLAGGIAHDFNNILNIIQGYAFVLRGQGLQSKESTESLNVINESIQRGSTLVQQLLTLARKTAATFEPANANAVVEGLMPLMAQTFPKTIDLGVDLEPDLPSITADANQISQALLNLCVNARDAMPGGDRLTLKTQAVDGASLGEWNGASAERYVCIEVTDTGIGMEESVRTRIFEPFFTTKEAGQGTGLGLAVVYGIVKNHNGFITVESKPMCGTTFRLYFPVAPASERQATELTTESGLKTVDSRLRENSSSGRRRKYGLPSSESAASTRISSGGGDRWTNGLRCVQTREGKHRRCLARHRSSQERRRGFVTSDERDQPECQSRCCQRLCRA